MGRRNGKSIVKEVVDTLNGMARYGQSRYDAKRERQEQGEKNINATDGIYSISTMKDYIKHSVAFVTWARGEYGVRTVADARQYVAEYIQMRIDRTLSASTIHLDTAAVSKLYGCTMQSWGIDRPERKRANIVRSRQEAKRDAHFNPANHPDLDSFMKATGVRRCELERVRPEDVSADGSSVHIIKGKGGKERLITILPAEMPVVRAIADKAQDEGRTKVFGRVSENIDVHAYRRDFAQRRYQYYVDNGMTEYHGKRNPIYRCRGDKKGTWYYRGAMLLVSKQLGHERESVIAQSYL